MRKREMNRLLKMIQRLSTEQRLQLLQRLQKVPTYEQVVEMVQSRLEPEVACPWCSSRCVVRNGHAHGLQRYKCRGCAKTFNALSGTPLARLRHKHKWLGQAEALSQGLIVREAALRLKVAASTAFRWRHRFLKLPQQLKAKLLQGVAEVDETYELRSFKGQRVYGRVSRERGGKASTRGMSKEHVPLLVGRDRSGATTDFVLEAASVIHVSAALGPVMAPDVVMCTDGSPMLASVAKALNLEHQALNLSKGVRVRAAWHIQNVNAYHSRFKNWLRRFHGVATSYLSSYLGWFRFLDRSRKQPYNPSQVLAMNLGV